MLELWGVGCWSRSCWSWDKGWHYREELLKFRIFYDKIFLKEKGLKGGSRGLQLAHRDSWPCWPASLVGRLDSRLAVFYYFYLNFFLFILFFVFFLNLILTLLFFSSFFLFCYLVVGFGLLALALFCGSKSFLVMF